MNPFEAIAEGRSVCTRYETSCRAHMLAMAITSVRCTNSQPDGEAEEQLYAVLRFARAAFGVELAGYLQGCHFDDEDFNLVRTTDFLAIRDWAHDYLDNISRQTGKLPEPRA